MKKLLPLFFLFILVPSVLASPGLVVPSSQDQDFDIQIPSSLQSNTPASGNHPVPILLVIDRLSSQENDKIHYILVCKNEGDTSGQNSCSFQARTKSQIFYEKSCGSINQPGSLSSCSGSFSVDDTPLYLTPYASSPNQTNHLIYKVPTDSIQKSIVALFNSPSLYPINPNSYVPNQELLYSGSPSTKDYGQYTWILEDLSLKDQQSNSIDLYPVNTKSFLKDEKILVFSYNSSSNNPSYPQPSSSWDFSDGNWSLSNSTIQISTDQNYEVFEAHRTYHVNPNSILNISSLIKTSDLEPRDDGNGVYLRARLRQPNGNVDEYTEKLEGDNSWEKYELSLNTRAADELILYLYHHRSSGKAWFDDLSVEQISNISKGEIINVGKYEDTAYTLYDNTELTVEPYLDLDYSEEEADTSGIVTNEDLEVEKTLKINSEASTRPQPFSLDPNSSKIKNDLVSDTCTMGNKDCWETTIIQPGSDETKTFKWKEEAFKMTNVGVQQNDSLPFTPELQHLIKKVRIKNTNSDRNFTNIEGSVFVNAKCNNWMESVEEIDWTSDWMKRRSCYFEVPKLNSDQSVTKKVRYQGDWIDLTLGPTEQDPTKQSTLQKQHLRKPIIVEKTGPLENTQINLTLSTNESEIPGNCTDCQRTITVGRRKPVLNLTFDELTNDSTAAQDHSPHNNDGTLKPNTTYGPTPTQGKFGQALHLDGEDDYVDVSSAGQQIGENGTISVWTKGDLADSTNARLFGGQQSSDYEIRTYGQGGMVISYFDTDAGNTLDPRVFNEDRSWEWVHITFAWNYNGTHTTMTAYGNGQAGETQTKAGKVVPQDTAFRLGRWSTHYYNGSIDDVRVYKRALSEEEIENLYTEVTKKQEDDSEYIHSVHEGIIYNISEPEESRTSNNLQFWKQTISVENRANLNFYNTTTSFSVNLSVENTTLESDEDITNLKINGSTISFKIPKLEANTSYSYKIIYATEKETQPEKTESTGFSITGQITRGVTNFFGSLVEERNLNEDLILYLPLDGGRTDKVIDKSPYNHTVTIHGNPGWTTGKEGLALKFDGKDDYIRAPSNIIPKTGTITFRTSVNWEGTERSDIRIIGGEDSTGDEIRTYGENGKLSLYMDLNETVNVEAFPDNPLLEKRWSFAAYTWNYNGTHTTLKAYGNGEFSDKVSEAGKITGQDEGLYVGRWGSHYLPGKVDDLRIYNKSLSEIEIKGIQKGNKTLNIINYPSVFIFIIGFGLLVAAFFERRVRR